MTPTAGSNYKGPTASAFQETKQQQYILQFKGSKRHSPGEIGYNHPSRLNKFALQACPDQLRKCLKSNCAVV
jgi:hypothetical protein